MKKGYIFVAALFLLAFLGIFISVAVFRSQMLLRLSDTRTFSDQAFWCAESGLEKVLTMVRNDDFSPFDTDTRPAKDDILVDESIEGGQIKVTMRDEPSPPDQNSIYWVYPVESTGSESGSGNQFQRTINADIYIAAPSLFFISTLGELIFKQGSYADFDVLARVIRFISPTSGNITINGNAIYLQSCHGDSDPNVFVNNVAKGKPFTFTGLDLDHYRSLAESDGLVIGTPGVPVDQDIIDGVIDGKTPDNGVIFVDGNVTVRGTFSKSIIIVASKELRISGNIQPPATSSPSPQIGLYAGEDIIIKATVPSTLVVKAFLRADGGVVEAKGGQFSKDNFNFTGAISARGGGENETAVNLSAFKTRTYNFNEELVSANTLPVKDLIADIRNWQEVY